MTTCLYKQPGGGHWPRGPVAIDGQSLQSLLMAPPPFFSPSSVLQSINCTFCPPRPLSSPPGFLLPLAHNSRHARLLPRGQVRRPSVRLSDRQRSYFPDLRPAAHAARGVLIKSDWDRRRRKKWEVLSSLLSCFPSQLLSSAVSSAPSPSNPNSKSSVTDGLARAHGGRRAEALHPAGRAGSGAAEFL